MATEVHLVRGGGSNYFSVSVEELGRTPPGGIWDAIDDRAEW